VRKLDYYWRTLTAKEQFSSPADIDLIDINRKFLPWFFLLEVLPGADELDYKF
jgi:hypothetical protein